MAARILCLLVLKTAILSALIGVTSQQQQQHDLKLKLSQLESDLDEITTAVNSRDQRIAECDKEIEELEKTASELRSSLADYNANGGTIVLPVDERIRVLEEEVLALWAVKRKNNFDLHVLESKAREAEERLELVKLKFDKMADVVNERWIQIQQFEQALQLKKVRLLKTQRTVDPASCKFLMFMDELFGGYLSKPFVLLKTHLFNKDSVLRSNIHQTQLQIIEFYRNVKNFHHRLQGFIKGEMLRHNFTASIANEELVFFMASALIVFPILGAWSWLSSQSRSSC